MILFWEWPLCQKFALDGGEITQESTQKRGRLFNFRPKLMVETRKSKIVDIPWLVLSLLTILSRSLFVEGK